MADLSTERVSFESALAALLDLYGIEGGAGGGGLLTPSRLTLINLVKAKLDELIPEGEGVIYDLEDSPNISDPYDLLIDAILDEAAKRVLINCPKTYLIPVKSDVTATADSADTKIGYIVLPDNFLRFISLKMAEWKRPVTELLPTDGEEYMMQFNQHIRGGLAKPKAAISHRQIANTTGGLLTVTLSSSNGGGTGYTPGTNVLTLVQTGGSLGTINATANVGGQIVSVDGVNVMGSGYSIENGIETTGVGNGCVVNITAIYPVSLYKRVLEYFSVMYSHTIDWLFYIQETAAEDVQSNLRDALTWMAAGMVQQILGNGELAKQAFEQEGACYNKLNNGN